METPSTLVVLLLFLVGSVASMKINFKPCGNNTQTIKSVDISPCDKQPCVFKHGINVTVKVDFIPAEASTGLSAEIYGIVAGIPVKFNMPNPNGCNNSGIVCPIKPSTEYIYTSEFFVQKSYPNIRLVVQWDLKADDGKYLFCFLFPMQIIS